jgi:hypothetical protein
LRRKSHVRLLFAIISYGDFVDPALFARSISNSVWRYGEPLDLCSNAEVLVQGQFLIDRRREIGSPAKFIFAHPWSSVPERQLPDPVDYDGVNSDVSVTDWRESCAFLGIFEEFANEGSARRLANSAIDQKSLILNIEGL